MIPVMCSACGRNYKLKDDLAGKKGKCECGSTMAIPPSLAKSAGDKTCLNCGVTVGPLQQLLAWNGKRVCVNCRETLIAEQDASDQLAAAAKADAEEKVRAKAESERAAKMQSEGKAFSRHKALSMVFGQAFVFIALGLLCIWITVNVLNRPKRPGDSYWPLFVVYAFPAAFLISAFASWLRYKKLAGYSASQPTNGDGASALRLASFWAITITAIITAALAPFLIAGLAGTVAKDHFDSTRQMGDESVLPLVIVIVVFIVSLLIPAVAIACVREFSARRCPNCGRIRETVVEAVQELGQEQRVERTTEHVKVWDKPGGVGQLGTIAMPTTRLTIIQHRAAHRRCKACSHTWTTRQNITHR